MKREKVKRIFLLIAFLAVSISGWSQVANRGYFLVTNDDGVVLRFEYGYSYGFCFDRVESFPEGHDGTVVIPATIIADGTTNTDGKLLPEGYYTTGMTSCGINYTSSAPIENHDALRVLKINCTLNDGGSLGNFNNYRAMNGTDKGAAPFASIVYQEDSPDAPTFYSENGILYQKNGDNLYHRVYFVPHGSTATYDQIIRPTTTAIGKSAFQYFMNLGNDAKFIDLDFPANSPQIEEIGWEAFTYNIGIKTVVFPEHPNYTTIERRMFAGAYNKNSVRKSVLKSLTIPSQITEIKYSAFEYCYELENTVDLSHVQTFGQACFNLCEKMNVKNNDLTSAISIDGSAFRYCRKMGDPVFSSALTSLGSKAFERTDFLNIDLSMCTSLTTVASYCFSCWWRGTGATLKLPTSITELKEACFAGVQITSLGYGTEPGEEGVLDLSRYNITEIGGAAFQKARVTTMKLPNTLATFTGASFYDLPLLEKFEVSDDHPLLQVLDNGVLYSKEEGGPKTIYSYPKMRPGKGYIVRPTVETLSECSFAVYNRVRDLTHLVLPSGLKTIKSMAMMQQGQQFGDITKGVLQEITIPASVTLIENTITDMGCEDAVGCGFTTTPSGGGPLAYGFNNITKMYFMHDDLSTLSIKSHTAKTYSGSGGISRPKVYVKKSTYDAGKYHTNTEGGYQYRDIASTGELEGCDISPDIPITFTSVGKASICRDFDVDLSESPFTAYVTKASSDEYNASTREITLVPVKYGSETDGKYIPSRFSTDNHSYMGAILKLDGDFDPEATYTYRIGEKDYASDSRYTPAADMYGDDQNILGSVAFATAVQGEDENGYTYFGLASDGKFQKFAWTSGTGVDRINYNKAYLRIKNYNSANNAKVTMFFSNWDDNNVTKIDSTEEIVTDMENAVWYTLQGVRLATKPTQQGIYLVNGKKYVIK